jgi:hypothetical protein
MTQSSRGAPARDMASSRALLAGTCLLALAAGGVLLVARMSEWSGVGHAAFVALALAVALLATACSNRLGPRVDAGRRRLALGAVVVALAAILLTLVLEEAAWIAPALLIANVAPLLWLLDRTRSADGNGTGG